MSKTESRFVDFRAVKAAVTMEQVLTHYGLTEKFKRGRDSLSGPCPIHQGSNPTQFRVCISKNCWNCFSECHCGGNVLDFVAKMENVIPMEAANRLVEWFQLDVSALNVDRPSKPVREEKEPVNARTTASPKVEIAVAEAKPPPIRVPPTPPSPSPKPETGTNKPLSFQLEIDQAHPYLTERGLTPETVREFGIGHCAKGVMSGRIAIPIRNVTGDLVGYSGRWPGDPPDGRPKYRLPDGFKKACEVYRLSEALREPAEKPLVIVEGFFDVMKLWQIGVRKSVALMGCSLSTVQEALILEHLPPSALIIVMFDEDNAGREGRQNVLLRFALKRFVRVQAFADEDFQPEKLTAAAAQLLQLA
jgi:DNA primase